MGLQALLQLPLPRADPLLPPQLVGAIYSRYVSGAGGETRTLDQCIKSALRYRCATPAYFLNIVLLTFYKYYIIIFNKNQKNNMYWER